MGIRSRLAPGWFVTSTQYPTPTSTNVTVYGPFGNWLSAQLAKATLPGEVEVVRAESKDGEPG